MRRALVKRVVTLLLLLTMVVPYCFVTYNDVYGDSKQNLSDANNKKSDLQSEYDKTQKKLDELKSQSDDVETYLAREVLYSYSYCKHKGCHRCDTSIT